MELSVRRSFGCEGDWLLSAVSRAELTGLFSLDGSTLPLQFGPLPPSLSSYLSLAAAGHLHSLRLHACGLTSLPESLCDLPLLALDLPSNQLTSLPLRMGSLTCLVRLGLSHNLLGGVPPPVLEIRSLEVLDLAANQIAHLDEEIACMHRLVDLNLSSNEIAILPVSLGKLHSLIR